MSNINIKWLMMLGCPWAKALSCPPSPRDASTLFSFRQSSAPSAFCRRFPGGLAIDLGDLKPNFTRETEIWWNVLYTLWSFDSLRTVKSPLSIIIEQNEEFSIAMFNYQRVIPMRHFISPNTFGSLGPYDMKPLAKLTQPQLNYHVVRKLNF